MSGGSGTARRLAPLILLASAAACSDSAHGAPPEQAALGDDAAARVGSDVIPKALVAKVAADQAVAPREAVRRLIDDAVSANGARSRGLDRSHPAAWLLIAARARWAAERSLAEARGSGPLSDAEIVEVTRQHWREVDRPEAVRVVHALVQRPKKPDEAAYASARALAAQLREAVLSAKDGDDFQARAKAVPHPAELDVIVQPLPLFAVDGAITEGEGGMVESFAKAAHTLTKAGETSRVVETPFGWHVIRLIERIPEERMPLDARRVAFAEEAFMQRARKLSEARLAALRPSAPIEISPSAERLMESLLGRGPNP